MARINLLPWREEQRKQRQQQFLVTLVVAVLVTGAAMGGVHFYVDRTIDFQKQRNAYLQKEIKRLDDRIKKIDAIDKTKRLLEARIKIIQDLQSSRPAFVHLFDELVKTLPDGVYLTSANQQGNKITVDGVAQSNARISTYMWNIEKSQWLTNPNLQVIQTAKQGGTRISKFVLTAEQHHKAPGAEEKKK